MLSSLKGWGANKRQHIKLAKYLQCDRIHHLRPSAKKSRFQVLVIQEFFIVQGIVNCVLTSWRFSCCLPFKGPYCTSCPEVWKELFFNHALQQIPGLTSTSMCELKKVGISEQRTNYLLVKKERKPTNMLVMMIVHDLSSQEASWTGIVDTTDSLCCNTQSKRKQKHRDHLGCRLSDYPLWDHARPGGLPRGRSISSPCTASVCMLNLRCPRKEKQDGDPIKQQWWKYVLRSILVLLYSNVLICRCLQLSAEPSIKPVRVSSTFSQIICVRLTFCHITVCEPDQRTTCNFSLLYKTITRLKWICIVDAKANADCHGFMDEYTQIHVHSDTRWLWC